MLDMENASGFFQPDKNQTRPDENNYPDFFKTGLTKFPTSCVYSNLARRLSTIPAEVMRKWVIRVHFHTSIATLNLKQKNPTKNH